MIILEAKWQMPNYRDKMPFSDSEDFINNIPTFAARMEYTSSIFKITPP